MDNYEDYISSAEDILEDVSETVDDQFDTDVETIIEPVIEILGVSSEIPDLIA